jgi:hypothetical protein
MVNGQQYFSYLIILLMRMNENYYVGKIKEIISICGNLHIRPVLWQWDGPTYKTGVVAMGWTYI